MQDEARRYNWPVTPEDIRQAWNRSSWPSGRSPMEICRTRSRPSSTWRWSGPTCPTLTSRRAASISPRRPPKNLITGRSPAWGSCGRSWCTPASSSSSGVLAGGGDVGADHERDHLRFQNVRAGTATRWRTWRSTRCGRSTTCSGAHPGRAAPAYGVPAGLRVRSPLRDRAAGQGGHELPAGRQPIEVHRGLPQPAHLARSSTRKTTTRPWWRTGSRC